MFSGLVDEVLHATAAWNPEWASTEGLRAFDDRVADRSPGAYAERVRALDAWRARLDDTDDGDPVDREALRFTLDLELFALTRLRTQEKNPDFASAFMDHLLPLLLRHRQPVAERADAMSARLAAAPRFLEGARRGIVPEAVPPLWVEIAVESVEQAPAFLDAVIAAVADAPDAARRRVEDATATAREALDAHARWLAHDLAPTAKGEWAIGRDAFDALLDLRGFRESSDALWQLGHDTVARFREEAEDAARLVLAAAGKTPGHDPVHEALAVASSDHPAHFDAVLTAYREAIDEARRFVADHGVASVPDVPVDVVETPAYLRHLVPFAAYIQPARFETHARGTYLVTPKMDLAAFHRAEVRNTTVHEAFPGHHLQGAVAREVPGLARFLVGENAPEMFEGWALYCEDLMGRHGFSSTPAERFVRAKDALWRAVRIVLDVGLHTGRIPFDDAVAMLTREVAMTQQEAAAEVKRYTLTPTYNLSYMYGRLTFERARAEAERAPDFDERAWHDRLMRQGALPLHLLFRAAAEDAARAR